jgi:hypothetical protein
MTTIKKVALVAAVVLCVLLPAGAISAGAATGGGSFPGAAPVNVGAEKATMDPDPPSPLTSDQQQALDEKRQAAEALLSKTASTATAGGRAATAKVASAVTASSTSDSLTMNQNPPKTSYWCGPASVNEALGQMPIPIVMDRHQSRVNYVGQPISASPMSSEIDLYKVSLLTNIGLVRAPLIGDAYEIPYGPRLNGHPVTKTIFHWFDIYGYTNNGAYTMYEDSVYNASAVGWHDLVTSPNGTIASSKIVQIVGGRGYVW